LFAVEEMKLLKTLPVVNLLGECVLWDDLAQAFLWTDILGGKLYRYHPATDRLTRWDTPERLCSFGLVAGEEGTLIAAFESGIAIYRYETSHVEWLARPEAGVTGTRFNDGRVDRQGRFWAGTMVEAEQAFDPEGNPVSASLYRVERGVCTRVEGGLRITNSLCWSLDSRRMYLADSPAHAIHLYDFDADTGSLGDPRPFVLTESPVQPDGSCVDAEDHVWNARWGGGGVARHRPDGSIDLTVPLPVSQPTCACFGGPGLNWLAITSARVELSEAELAGQPQAGSLFLFEMEYQGVDEVRYIRS
jgi:sugar lactone lactonase YvrE